MRRLSTIALRTAALLLAGTLLPVVAAAAPAAALQPFDAVYTVRIKGLRGEMDMSLSATTDRFAATSTLRARGFASLFARGKVQEYANFNVVEFNLMPQEYGSSDTLGSNDSAIEMRFDWQSARAQGSEDGQSFEHPAERGTYDRVTLQYALMLDLLNGGLAENYVLLDGKDLKELTVTRVGEQSIEVPLGTYDAIGVSHRSGNSSRVTTLWCAPELGFLPVRIEQHRNGKLNVRAELMDYQPATPSVTASEP